MKAKILFVLAAIMLIVGIAFFPETLGWTSLVILALLIVLGVCALLSSQNWNEDEDESAWLNHP